MQPLVVVMYGCTDAECNAGLPGVLNPCSSRAWRKGLLSGTEISVGSTLVFYNSYIEQQENEQLVFRAALSTEVDRDDAQKVEEAPKPVVKIDNQHDPFATVVSIQYGNRLGELLDTVCIIVHSLQQCCISAQL